MKNIGLFLVFLMATQTSAADQFTLQFNRQLLPTAQLAIPHKNLSLNTALTTALSIPTYKDSYIWRHPWISLGIAIGGTSLISYVLWKYLLPHFVTKPRPTGNFDPVSISSAPQDQIAIEIPLAEKHNENPINAEIHTLQETAQANTDRSHIANENVELTTTSEVATQQDQTSIEIPPAEPHNEMLTTLQHIYTPKFKEYNKKVTKHSSQIQNHGFGKNNQNQRHAHNFLRQTTALAQQLPEWKTILEKKYKHLAEISRYPNASLITNSSTQMTTASQIALPNKSTTLATQSAPSKLANTQEYMCYRNALLQMLKHAGIYQPIAKTISQWSTPGLQEFFNNNSETIDIQKDHPTLYQQLERCFPGERQESPASLLENMITHEQALTSAIDLTTTSPEYDLNVAFADLPDTTQYRALAIEQPMIEAKFESIRETVVDIQNAILPPARIGEYTLIGAAYRYGATDTGGHIVSFVNQQGTWYLCDDENIQAESSIQNDRLTIYTSERGQAIPILALYEKED